jgi:hypothetical protein
MVYMDMISWHARRKAYRSRMVSIKGKELRHACEALAMLIPNDVSVCTDRNVIYLDKLLSNRNSCYGTSSERYNGYLYTYVYAAFTADSSSQ